MDTTPSPERQPAYAETVTSSTGREWTVIVDPDADDDGLTEEEADAMVRASIERSEKQIEQFYREGWDKPRNPGGTGA